MEKGTKIFGIIVTVLALIWMLATGITMFFLTGELQQTVLFILFVIGIYLLIFFMSFLASVGFISVESEEERIRRQVREWDRDNLMND